MIDDSVRRKRLSDALAGAKAGFDTTAEDDARLRQVSVEKNPEHGEQVGPEKDDQAERTAKTIERQNPYWAMWHDPGKREEFVNGLREALGISTPRRAVKQEPGKSWRERDDDFWVSDEPKKIMPKKF